MIRPMRRILTGSLAATLLILGAAEPVARGEEPAPRAVARARGAGAGRALDNLFSFLENEVVWAATKTAQSAEDAPAAVTVVTAEDLQRWGYRSVAEVLQQISGFYLVNDFIVPNAGVRGIAGGLRGGSGNLKVMLDGHTIAFRTDGANWLGPELVPLTAVQRIEIVRGPASALYGADAFLAVINIVTRSGKEISGGRISAGVTTGALGRFGFDADGAVGAQAAGFELLVSARLNQEDFSGLQLPESSPRPFVPAIGRTDTAADHLISDSAALMARLGYEWGRRLRLSVMGHYQTITRGGEFSPWTQLSYGYDQAGRLNETLVALYQATLTAKLSANPRDDLELTLSGRFFNGGPRASDRIEVGSDAFFVRRDFGYTGAAVLGEARYKPTDKMTAVGGVEFEWDEENLISRLNVLKLNTGAVAAGEVDEDASTRQGSASLWNVGAFSQFLWQVHERYLNLTGGVRLDHHVLYGNQPSGRAAIVSKPLPQLVLKLLYGSSFKAPPPLLLYSIPLLPGDVKGTLDLEPQFVHTGEVIAAYRPTGWLELRSGLAYSHLSNHAVFVQQGAHRVAQNIAEMRALSWTAEASASDGRMVEGYAGAELSQVSRDFGQSGYQRQIVGLNNPTYPPWILRAGVSARLPWLPLSASAQLLYAAPRAASDMNVLENGAPYELDPYVMLNATLSTTGLELLPRRPTTLKLIGRNLLNVTVADPGFAGVDYPLAPLTLYLQLEQVL